MNLQIYICPSEYIAISYITLYGYYYLRRREIKVISCITFCSNHLRGAHQKGLVGRTCIFGLEIALQGRFASSTL